MSDLIVKDLVCLKLKASDKTDAIRQMAKLIEKQGRLESYEEYVKSVLDRENEFSTNMGMGIAIPHGKSASVKVPTVAFAKVKKAMDWGEDDDPINMIFLLAVPGNDETNANEHLRILAALSRKLIHDEFRESLLKAKNENTIVSIISSVL
ncbi:hypothetical protein AN639_10195 [Candidatus Epulonipiscium fishelsonii]|uniref:Uncharacterized protein n=1 Tax=Candidatus Epulonipiscium fishelsonii TaxID=77094 RepID=A0ACC8XCV7_9FIRM|nr:hypothetical protein AN396_05685 [Epulopiscium sp. SCG-B11WGA-EpuloA1]ONI43629.1 hypothetical protein AN639_10195 [Epulopiscium sp. SCG-B05WGA-EpuloA1]ONI46876.1 hypothetical protein AN644_02345 [Epulopiscium sp. SCG-C06WGA-EpuloA1]